MINYICKWLSSTITKNIIRGENMEKTLEQKFNNYSMEEKIAFLEKMISLDDYLLKSQISQEEKDFIMAKKSANEKALQHLLNGGNVEMK